MALVKGFTSEKTNGALVILCCGQAAPGGDGRARLALLAGHPAESRERHLENFSRQLPRIPRGHPEGWVASALLGHIASDDPLGAHPSDGRRPYRDALGEQQARDCLVRGAASKVVQPERVALRQEELMVVPARPDGYYVVGHMLSLRDCFAK